MQTKEMLYILIIVKINIYNIFKVFTLSLILYIEMHVIKKNKHPSDFSTVAFNFGYYSLLLRSKKTVLTNIWRILSSVSYTYA